MNKFRMFLQDDTGAVAMEYGMIGALMSIMLISGATAIGNAFGGTYGAVETALK